MKKYLVIIISVFLFASCLGIFKNWEDDDGDKGHRGNWELQAGVKEKVIVTIHYAEGASYRYGTGESFTKHLDRPLILHDITSLDQESSIEFFELKRNISEITITIGDSIITYIKCSQNPAGNEILTYHKDSVEEFSHQKHSFNLFNEAVWQLKKEEWRSGWYDNVWIFTINQAFVDSVMNTATPLEAN